MLSEHDDGTLRRVGGHTTNLKEEYKAQGIKQRVKITEQTKDENKQKRQRRAVNRNREGRSSQSNSEGQRNKANIQRIVRNE